MSIEKKISILIVDDIPANLLALEALLSDIDVNIVKANSGQEALVQSVRNELALVLLDVQMPEMDGFETAELMRGNSKTKNIPIIFVTAINEDNQYKFKGYSVGAVDFIFKPVDPIILQSKVKVFCELFQQRKDLEKAQRQLLETARQAGMAEVATSVLHNIGNILNSLNVSVYFLESELRKAPCDRIERTVGLINEHKANLNDFFLNNEKGKLLPEYLLTVAKALVNLQQESLNTIATMKKNVEVINRFINLQESVAKKSDFTQEESLPDIIEDAINLCCGDPNSDIKLIKNIEQTPLISTDRHKLLQIIINLLNNAKESAEKSQIKEPQITISLKNHSLTRIEIDVTDNGIGIEKEAIDTIFSFGYSTKNRNSSFGLHGCSLFAKELGGSLTAHSNGIDQGATFTVILPIRTSP